MNHPSELTSEEALRYLIECSLMSGTNAAKAGAIERLRTDIKTLADVRTLDAAGAHVARECGMWRLYTPTRAEWLTEPHDTTPDDARAKAIAWLRAREGR